MGCILYVYSVWLTLLCSNEHLSFWVIRNMSQVMGRYKHSTLRLHSTVHSSPLVSWVGCFHLHLCWLVGWCYSIWKEWKATMRRRWLRVAWNKVKPFFKWHSQTFKSSSKWVGLNAIGPRCWKPLQTCLHCLGKHSWRVSILKDVWDAERHAEITPEWKVEVNQCATGTETLKFRTRS